MYSGSDQCKRLEAQYPAETDALQWQIKKSNCQFMISKFTEVFETTDEHTVTKN